MSARRDRRFAGADCLATSYALAQAIRALGMPELVLCGQQTTDGDTAQVGAELAEFLDLPHAANVRALADITATGVTAEMDLPAHVLTIDIPFPCLLTVEKGIVTPRLPSFKIKQATRTQPIRTLTLDELADSDPAHYGLNGSPTRVQRIFPPEMHHDNVTWNGPPDELAHKLTDLLRQKKML